MLLIQKHSLHINTEVDRLEVQLFTGSCPPKTARCDADKKSLPLVYKHTKGLRGHFTMAENDPVFFNTESADFCVLLQHFLALIFLQLVYFKQENATERIRQHWNDIVQMHMRSVHPFIQQLSIEAL